MPHAALRELLALAGLEGAVSFSGTDPS